MRREEKAEAKLSGSSRGARGCSALLAGLATLFFGAATIIGFLIAILGRDGPDVAMILAAAAGGGITAGLGFLTQRWARGHSPIDRVPVVEPAEIKALAAKMEAEEEREPQ